MEPPQIIEYLKTMKTAKDLASLLNLIKKDEYKTVRYRISEKMLGQFSSDLIAPKRYRKFHIRKKSGGLREIKAPCRQLEIILKCLNIVLKAIYEPSDVAMGFTSGKSVVSNAMVHVGHNYVFNIDLKDFFPSIPQARVWMRLQLPPFRFPQEVANVVAGLCCSYDENVGGNVLPQGSPASPLLTNAICDNLDRRMKGVARRFGLHYTRYADDMTFSSMHNVYQEGSEFRKELSRIVMDQGFRMNESKTRLLKRGGRQEVTGLTVNAVTNVVRSYVRDLRWILHVWEKDGYAKAYARFYTKYKQDKGYIKKGEPVMENVIGGKLDYLRMVRGAANEAYKKLAARYGALQQLVYVDNDTDKKESYIYVQPYTIDEFQELFHTEIRLEKTTGGKVVGKCEIDGREKYLSISKSTQKILCPEPDTKSEGERIESPELANCYMTLCRKKGKNFWLITKFEPKRSRCLSIQNAAFDVDELLDVWENVGLEAAVGHMESLAGYNNFDTTKGVSMFIRFFLRKKSLTAGQKSKRDFLLARDSQGAVTEVSCKFDVEAILDEWENKGIDAAMKIWRKALDKQTPVQQDKAEEKILVIENGQEDNKNEETMDSLYFPTEEDIENAETIAIF